MVKRNLVIVCVCLCVLSAAPALSAGQADEYMELLAGLKRTGEDESAIAKLLQTFPLGCEGPKPSRDALKKAGYGEAIAKALFAKPAAKPLRAKALIGDEFSEPGFPVTLSLPPKWRVVRNHPLFAPSLILTPAKLSLEATDLEYGILAGVLSSPTAANPLTGATRLFDKYWKLLWKQRLNEDINVVSARLQMLGDVPAVVYDVELRRAQPQRTRKGIMAVTATDDVPIIFAAVIAPNSKRRDTEQIESILCSVRLVIAPKGWKSITTSAHYSLWIPPGWTTTEKGATLWLAASEHPRSAALHMRHKAFPSDKEDSAQSLARWIAVIGRNGYLTVSDGPMPLNDLRKSTGYVAVLDGKNPISEREEKYLVGVIQHEQSVLYLTASAWEKSQFEPFREQVMKVIATIRF